MLMKRYVNKVNTYTSYGLTFEGFEFMGTSKFTVNEDSIRIQM